ncbi:hypothetical protein EDD17DRAFT_1487413, partial [Pisolithus thermaeus]
IRYLTNESGALGILSRRSFHHGSGLAAEWSKTRFEYATVRHGASCSFGRFCTQYRLIHRYRVKTEGSKTVFVSGHYISRGYFFMERVSRELARALLVPQASFISQALGRNDDGLGTISILNIAPLGKANRVGVGL